MGAPLEDARHLAQRYDRMRQEAEAQVFSNKAILLGYMNMLSIFLVIISLHCFNFSNIASTKESPCCLPSCNYIFWIGKHEFFYVCGYA